LNEKIYKKRNEIIAIILVFIWIFTLVGGFIGRWRIMTAPMLTIMTVFLTVFCVKNIKSRENCNICLGICSTYYSFLCLLCAYKLLYWQFAISAWYLIVGIAVWVLISLFILWIFIQNDKEIKKTKAVGAWTVGGFAFLFSTMLARSFRELNLEDPNQLAVPIVAICLALLGLSMALGIRYLVLDDDKMLYSTKLDGE